MKKRYGFAILLIAFLLNHVPIPAAFSTTTNLFVNPPKTTVLLGETFSINITVSNVADLKGWALKLYYRSTLNAINITEGPFLRSGGNLTFLWVHELDAPFNSTHNRICVLGVILGNVSGVSGTGTLATVTFNVTQQGSSILHLSDTDLRDSTIVYAIPHTTTDGFVAGGLVASFQYSPTNPIVSETITFNATLSEGEAIISYSWDFGDGTNGTGVVTTHAYMSYGNYTATLTIMDSEGSTDSESKQINIRQHPIADFTYSPSLPQINETIVFNASNSKPNGGTIISYEWDFGDGESGFGMVVNHTYTTEGTYTVTLTVTDSEGLTDSIWKIVLGARDVAVTSVTVSPNMTYVGRIVNITVTVNNLGGTKETFDVNAYYNNNLIETKSVTLDVEENTTLTFNWNTKGTTPCHNYTIKAEASTVPYEIDTANNVYIYGEVKIKILGDTDGNGSVDIFDLVPVATAYGCHLGDLFWDERVDFNGDGVIDVFDLVIAALNFGETC